MNAPSMAAAAPPAREVVGPQFDRVISFGRALLVLAAYGAVAQGGQLLSGLDLDDVTRSASRIVQGLVVPVALGIGAAFLVAGRSKWRDAVIERSELRLNRPWLWIVPGFIALAVAGAALATSPRGARSGAVVLALMAGTLLVGFGEESVFRGFLLVGARSRFSELGAFALSTGVFGLAHGINVLVGESPTATLGQIAFAMVVGSAFYVTRRVSGSLVIPIVLHGLINFASALNSPVAGS